MKLCYLFPSFSPLIYSYWYLSGVELLAIRSPEIHLGSFLTRDSQSYISSFHGSGVECQRVYFVKLTQDFKYYIYTFDFKDNVVS